MKLSELEENTFGFIHILNKTRMHDQLLLQMFSFYENERIKLLSHIQ